MKEYNFISNFTLWDRIQEFDAIDATCLAYKVDPQDYINNVSVPHDIQRKIELLSGIIEKDFEDRNIDYTLGSRGYATGVKKYKRIDYERYAKLNGFGFLPEFLFPEERKRNDNQDTNGSHALFPAGLNWDKITITLLDKDCVSIETPSKTEKYAPAELGMTDKRKGNQTKEVWRTLMLFCCKTGLVSSENTKHIGDLSGMAKRFNKSMQELFDIKESIFKSHYRAKSQGMKKELKVSGYETKANFRSKLTLNKSAEDYINEPQENDLNIEQEDMIHPYQKYNDDTDNE